MGVTGLWHILEPSARPTTLSTLNRKRLAIDASIWIYQFLKAVRDKEGNALHNSHIVGFFRRICKLLYFGIKPVFIFDGGAPILKRQTILRRKTRREGRREDAVRTAGKLLAVQLKNQRMEEKLRIKNDSGSTKGKLLVNAEDEVITSDRDLVYVDEIGMSVQERNQNRKFHKTDPYHLPELENGIEGMGQPNDPRIMSPEELEAYAKQFNDGEDVNLYDLGKIDFNGDFFMSLPASDRYNILNAARLRSRLRMGLSKEQLEKMFPDRMAFSRFQIERVRERNELTQRLMNLSGMNDDLIGVGNRRIAGDSSREYVLVKNEGVEGGYSLGVVRTHKNVEGERNKPIDLDAVSQSKFTREDSDEDDEFEDIPVEGLNRLPTLKEKGGLGLESLELSEFEKQSLQNNLPQLKDQSDVSDSLFVEDKNSNACYYQQKNEEVGIDQALTMSLPKEDNWSGSEDEHVRQAIALSLEKNYYQGQQKLEVEDPRINFKSPLNQKAVDPPNPISATQGGVIAHIINNRANAAVSKRKSSDLGSDSDDDFNLQATLAKARRQASFNRKNAPTNSTEKKGICEILPFEKLESLFKNSKEIKSQNMTTIDEEDKSKEEDTSGGFIDESENEKKPRPIPPWLMDQNDIRSDFEIQRKKDIELNLEDKKIAEEEQQKLLRDTGPFIVDSSGDEAEKSKIPHSNTIPLENTKDKIVSTTSQNQLSDDSESDRIEWSESDYGDADHIAKDARSRTIPSESPEFEDIQITTGYGPIQENDALSTKNTRGGLENTAEQPTPRPLSSASSSSSSSPLEKHNAENLVIDPNSIDYSDSEDEELHAQLALEAEEHGRFASTLNNKSELENQQDYERELKTLRSQQKKDRRDADEVSQTMITECKALLTLFGLPYITAPMEAEAQCAELVRLGLVDGVVTDDSDIFLFGGTRVYKNMFNSNKYVECYLASDIEKELSLSREQLISLAHLLGSDYTDGLPGIGPVTALEIISEFPSISEFASWWSTAQYSTDPETTAFRQKFRRTQAVKLFLPPGFPSPAVTEAYWRPEVDESSEEFKWGVPDLDLLREFFMQTIGWSKERTDEVLLPVIRDMNRREVEGTQSNITQFFDGGQGAGVRGPAGGSNIHSGSKRMRDAVGKLKSKKQGVDRLSKTFADEAREWVEREKTGRNKGSEGQTVRKNKKRGKKKNSEQDRDS